MKTLIIILASLLNLTAYASSKNASDAEVGETFALKQDVILNEGVPGKYLYTNEKEVILKNGSKYTSSLYCTLRRSENGEDCPNYPKVIVNKGKYRVIRSENSNYYQDLINISVSEKKNSCKYTLAFSCVAIGYDSFNDTFKKLIMQEINYQASKLIDVKEDATEPKPWP